MLFFALPFAVTQSGLADKKEDAITFLDSTTSKLPEVLRCFNCEILDTWSEKGKRIQEWQRVRAGAEGFCVYSGITANPKIQIEDPAAWQSDPKVVIPARDFYQVDLGNDQYTASFVDLSRFEEGGEKSLERVQPVSRPIRPGILAMMCGEFLIDGSVAEFIRSPTVEVVEFDDVKNSDGPAVTRLVVDCGPSNRDSRSAPDQITWKFDARTGACTYCSSELGTLKRDYAVEYSEPKNGIMYPKKATMTSPAITDRVQLVRDFTTACTMNPGECLLSYHGFSEPDLMTGKPSAAGNWLLWGNVGIIFLLLGYLIRRRFAVH
jgi:hypothetical protein